MFFDLAVGTWGIAPTEFWQMSPAEWWRLYERKRPRDPEHDYAGGLTQGDVERLHSLLGKTREEVQSGG